MKTADQLLSELTHLLGLEEGVFDDNRLYGFLLNDKYRVTLLGNSEAAIFIYALLGEWPESGPDKLFMELMTANLIFLFSTFELVTLHSLTSQYGSFIFMSTVQLKRNKKMNHKLKRLVRSLLSISIL